MAESVLWKTFSEAYAFLGNSLLAPMSQTSHVGLDPDFWRAFPDFDDSPISEAISKCVDCAERFAQQEREGKDAVREVSVEYTKLFVGPPSPSAAPWETMYQSDTTIGFGEATIQMRSLLRESGLELRNENHQYEDHMGIELLYLSKLCFKRATENEIACGDDSMADGVIFSFIETHPLAWIGAFRKRIAQTFPDGYFVCIVDLIEALLRHHSKLLVG